MSANTRSFNWETIKKKYFNGKNRVTTLTELVGLPQSEFIDVHKAMIENQSDEEVRKFFDIVNAQVINKTSPLGLFYLSKLHLFAVFPKKGKSLIFLTKFETSQNLEKAMEYLRVAITKLCTSDDNKTLLKDMLLFHCAICKDTRIQKIEEELDKKDSRRFKEEVTNYIQPIKNQYQYLMLAAMKAGNLRKFEKSKNKLLVFLKEHTAIIPFEYIVYKGFDVPGFSEAFNNALIGHSSSAYNMAQNLSVIYRAIKNYSIVDAKGNKRRMEPSVLETSFRRKQSVAVKNKVITLGDETFKLLNNNNATIGNCSILTAYCKNKNKTKIIKKERAVDIKHQFTQRHEMIVNKDLGCSDIDHLYCDYDMGNDNTYSYFVLNNMGDDLTQWLTKKERTISEKLDVSIKLMEKLAQLHNGTLSKTKTKYAHRDIKPANITLDDNNNLHFIDFGLTTERLTANRINDKYSQGTKEYLPFDRDKMEDNFETQFYDKKSLVAMDYRHEDIVAALRTIYHPYYDKTPKDYPVLSLFSKAEFEKMPDLLRELLNPADLAKNLNSGLLEVNALLGGLKSYDSLLKNKINLSKFNEKVSTMGKLPVGLLNSNRVNVYKNNNYNASIFQVQSKSSNEYSKDNKNLNKIYNYFMRPGSNNQNKENIDKFNRRLPGILKTLDSISSRIKNKRQAKKVITCYLDISLRLHWKYMYHGANYKINHKSFLKEKQRLFNRRMAIHIKYIKPGMKSITAGIK